VHQPDDCLKLLFFYYFFILHLFFLFNRQRHAGPGRHSRRPPAPAFSAFFALMPGLPLRRG
jgi:hypothetical protein